MVLVVAFVIGYGFGLFAFSNIVLSLFWSLPESRRLRREGKLTKPIPVTRFLIAPLVWSPLVVGSLLLVNIMFSAASLGYVAGLMASLGQTVRLVFSPNADMEADFADTFRAYLRNERAATAP